jgi:hypothetical protein
MTRREWLQKNPPPQPAGPLLDRAAELEAQGKATEAATIRGQASAAPARCPLHPSAPLYRHQNRQEDLYVCKQGPHFLMWTPVGARAQLVPLTKLDLPDIDAEMK